MRLIQLVPGIALFCITFIGAAPASAETPVAPDEQDRQVLESLLRHLQTDPKFDLTLFSTNGTEIVLHNRTPEKTGFLSTSQIHSDIGDRTLPGDAETDLRRRNTSVDAKPGTYESINASYTSLTFASGIVVTNLEEVWKQRRMFSAFGKAYPKARGWLQAYLPGYSPDGAHAVVRASVGPAAHAATLTGVLEKAGEKWVVKWYHITFYM
jgi:hypothetical protein